ncbi:MAG: O-methyltransferase [Anaerovoracaceae bacterium]|mgnify:CR=1 FL=1|nr:O-methyltransferase [Anaerovoracaceae bacterium]
MNITNNIITAYINNLYCCSNPKLQELRRFAEEKKVPIILKDTEGLLLSLLRIKKPARLLEIGAAVGYSACCFADGCGCSVTTIEADEEAYKTALANVENLGFSDKVTVLGGDARDVLENMASEITDDKLFDVVFIDAAKSHYKTFWDLSLPLCRQDALIICDNVLMKGMTASDEYDPGKKYKTSIRRMREFVKYITELDYADTCILPVGDGISLSVINKKINM